MSQSTENRVALVTGGAKRVGRAVALRLAEAGFDIAFTYLSSAGDAKSFVEEIKRKSRACVTIRADLTHPEKAVGEIGAKFRAKFGRLDVLVNNASLYAPDVAGSAEQLAQMRRFWAIHVESPLLLCRELSPMLEKAGGCVVNMLDLQAERPIPKYLAYCASKAGLWNLTLGLAREMAPRVRVNGIAPGVVEWPADLPEAKRAEYLRRVPLKRAGTPGDVAEAVHFLSAGAGYMTGQILRLDGGRSIC